MKTNQQPSYDELFEMYCREHQHRENLESVLSITQTQSDMYARELANVFRHTKVKRKQLAITNIQLEKYASDLRTTLTDLKSAHFELQEAYCDTIHRLVLASEYKDKDTGNHIARISRYCSLLASKLDLSEYEIEYIGYAAPMHDVGKIGIPDNIILKNGMLTDREFSIIKTHTTIGADILQHSKARVLQLARTIALSHHERWNGSGYPSGLSKNQIPLSARIVSLIDAFDALTSKRPYKSPYPIDISCEIIRQERERHFDPELVDVFLSHINEITTIKQQIDKTSPLTAIPIPVIWSERDQKS